MKKDTIFCQNCSDSMYDEIYGWNFKKYYQCSRCISFKEIKEKINLFKNQSTKKENNNTFIFCPKCAQKLNFKCTECEKKLEEI